MFLYVYTYITTDAERPEETFSYPGAGVTMVCDLPNMGAGN